MKKLLIVFIGLSTNISLVIAQSGKPCQPLKELDNNKASMSIVHKAEVVVAVKGNKKYFIKNVDGPSEVYPLHACPDQMYASVWDNKRMKLLRVEIPIWPML